MLKAEKYKERIKELGYRFALCNGELKRCKEIRCDECAFYEGSVSCMKHINKWLLEEYTEPVLNDEGIEFLKHHIECSGKKALYIKITKKVANYYEYRLEIHLDTGLISIPFAENSDLYEMFKNMEIGVGYTPEELGL